MFHPKLSIITIVYNNARDIERTMLSVFNQTYTNIEYLIIQIIPTFPGRVLGHSLTEYSMEMIRNKCIQWRGPDWHLKQADRQTAKPNA